MKYLLFFAFLAIGLFVRNVHCYTVTFNNEGEDGENDQGRPLLGRSPCTYGPSYWCKNITTAKSCSAADHCIKKVWTGMSLPEDNDDVCKICKDMVAQARDQLLSNETQSDLKAVLEGSCALIPVSLVASECKKLMDDFIPELVDALASRMDPQVVCAVSGLCNSARIDTLLSESALTCPSCAYYMTKAFSYLNSTSNLQSALLDQCGYLGSYSDSCSSAVLEEFEVIQTHINGANSVEFCQLVGICSEGQGQGSMTSELTSYKPSEDLSCDFCKQLVTHLRDWMSQNTTREEFDVVVGNLCKDVGKYEKDCKEFFNTYGNEIWQLVLDDLDAESFCERLGVCPGSKLVEGGPIWTILQLPEKDEPKMASLLPGETLIGTDERGGVGSGELIGQDDLVGENPRCELCSYAMTELQAYLDSPATEKSIEDWVENLCSRHLPPSLSSQCTEFVNEYGDEVIQLIGDEVDPKEICPRLGLCPVKTPKDILPTCPLCTFTITKILNMIGRNRTKESIESAMDKVCKMLPRKYTRECEEFMKNYGDEVLEMILIEGSSHEICAALHLCLMVTEVKVKVKVNDTAEVNDLSIPGPILVGDEPQVGVVVSQGQGQELEVQNGDDPKCVLCEYVIQMLAERIKDNATEAEIKIELQEICTHLPKTVTKKCSDFVTNYGDLILSYLIMEMNPQQICTELKLCKSVLKLTECQLCGLIVDYFHVKVGSDPVGFSGATAIDTGIQRLCGGLGDGLVEQCTSMTEDYGPYLLQLVQQAQGSDNENEVDDPDSEGTCRVVALC